MFDFLEVICRRYQITIRCKDNISRYARTTIDSSSIVFKWNFTKFPFFPVLKKINESLNTNPIIYLIIKLTISRRYEIFQKTMITSFSTNKKSIINIDASPKICYINKKNISYLLGLKSMPNFFINDPGI